MYFDKNNIFVLVTSIRFLVKPVRGVKQRDMMVLRESGYITEDLKYNKITYLFKFY